MEYNVLTKRLLQEGFTSENYPEYVMLDRSRLPGEDPLNTLSGGFLYKRQYCHELVYMTGCGKKVKGKNVISEMFFMGQLWSHENDCPVICCPYDKETCPHNDKRLWGEHGGKWCACHQTEEPYSYENSIEEVNDERNKDRERKYQEYAEAHHGHVCRQHMYYSEKTKTWELHYLPSDCANFCYSQGGYCPILDKQLSKKRGNVYYDLKRSGVYEQGLIEEPWCRITKGIRFFKKPCSMDICEAFVKIQKDMILKVYEMNHSYEKFFDKSLQFEILNVRAEYRPSRDLEQDLIDLKAGITIDWDPDLQKNIKEEKRQRRAKAKEKRIKKLEKVLVEVGYENLPVGSIDRLHADKWLSEERKEELAIMREQRNHEKKMVQLSLMECL